MGEEKEAGAPTTAMEPVNVVRPLKVVALLTFGVASLAQFMAVMMTFWVGTGATRLGLFQECTSLDEELLHEHGMLEDGPMPGECMPARPEWAFVKVVAAFSIISFILLIVAMALMVMGLNATEFGKKYLYYRLALYFSLFAVLLNLTSALTLPVCFYLEMKERGRPSWYFHYSYVICWIGTLVAFGGDILLICDKEHEEVYYKEKVVYSASG